MKYFPADVSKPWPVINSDKEEFILTPHSEFNITCSGESRVTWIEPLPVNSKVHSGVNHSTLVITDVVALNTRPYTCAYEDQPENGTDIYIFVPGIHYCPRLLNILQIISGLCICKKDSHLFLHRSWGSIRVWTYCWDRWDGHNYPLSHYKPKFSSDSQRLAERGWGFCDICPQNGLFRHIITRSIRLRDECEWQSSSEQRLWCNKW